MVRKCGKCGHAKRRESVAVIWRRIFRIFIPFLWDTVTSHADTRPHIAMCLEVRLANLPEKG